MALVISNSKGSVSFLRTVILTLLPTGPLNFSTALFSGKPLIDFPSMPIIKSPGNIPALCAGVSSIGETTLTTLFSKVISIPKPPKVPFVFTCISL